MHFTVRTVRDCLMCEFEGHMRGLLEEGYAALDPENCFQGSRPVCFQFHATSMLIPKSDVRPSITPPLLYITGNVYIKP